MHFVTLATPELDAARTFPCDGLGWSTLVDVAGEIIMFGVAPGLVLGPFDSAKFDQDLLQDPSSTGVSGLTLAQNVDSREDVVQTMEAMVGAGWRIEDDGTVTLG